MHLALQEDTDGKAKVAAEVLSSGISVEQTADGMNPKRNQVQPSNRGASMERGFIVQQHSVAQACTGRGGLIAPIELHRLQRIPQRRSGGGQMATIGSRGPHVNSLLDCFRVQKGNRSATVFAHTVVLKIDGGTALGAADLTYLGAQVAKFQFSQVADELLFAQELKERREPSVAAWAPEIGEPTGFADIETQRQRVAAARTGLLRRLRPRHVVAVSIYFLEQLDDGSRCQLHAFEVIEPDDGTRKAQIELHGALLVLLQRLCLHGLSAIRAGKPYRNVLLQCNIPFSTGAGALIPMAAQKLRVPIHALISITLHSKQSFSTVIRTSTLFLRACLLLAWSIAGSGAVAAANAPIPARAPSINCVGNDEVDSSQTQKGASVPIRVEQSIADQIAYYKAEHGSGIFAPKGWYCRAWNGSNGSFLAVTPKPIPPPYFPLPSIGGPAVTIATWDGESSGRVRVAIVASQLFAVAGSEFVARVRQEHLISDSAFDPESYPDDQLQYLSDRFVEYTTPANRAGLGTDGMLDMSNLPIRGLTILNRVDEANSLIEVRVRLPPNLSSLTEPILTVETSCVQLPKGCRSLQ